PAIATATAANPETIRGSAHGAGKQGAERAGADQSFRHRRPSFARHDRTPPSWARGERTLRAAPLTQFWPPLSLPPLLPPCWRPPGRRRACSPVSPAPCAAVPPPAIPVTVAFVALVAAAPAGRGSAVVAAVPAAVTIERGTSTRMSGLIGLTQELAAVGDIAV